MLESIVKEVISRKKASVYAVAITEGQRMMGEAKQNAPWTDRTATTRGAIHGGAEISPNGATLYLAHGNEVGWYLEEGTGIYGPKGKPIRPKTAKALAFQTPDGFVITKEVKGMPAQPIIKPTVERNFQKVARHIGEVVRDA